MLNDYFRINDDSHEYPITTDDDLWTDASNVIDTDMVRVFT